MPTHLTRVLAALASPACGSMTFSATTDGPSAADDYRMSRSASFAQVAISSGRKSVAAASILNGRVLVPRAADPRPTCAEE
jgi:hypothetical protein